MSRLQALADIVLRLTLQVKLLSEKQEYLEKSLGVRGELKTAELKTTGPGEQAKPPEAELPEMH
ncbi:MAG: hypothetical protein ACJ8AT_03605 [Hyalangium sp.]